MHQDSKGLTMSGRALNKMVYRPRKLFKNDKGVQEK